MKNIQPKKSQQELAQDFFKEYQVLCEKHQAQIVVTPGWRATNHGSFELVQQSSVGKLPKQE